MNDQSGVPLDTPFWQIWDRLKCGELEFAVALQALRSPRIVKRLSVAACLRLCDTADKLLRGVRPGLSPNDKPVLLALIVSMAEALFIWRRLSEADVLCEMLVHRLRVPAQAAHCLLLRADIDAKRGLRSEMQENCQQAAEILQRLGVKLLDPAKTRQVGELLIREGRWNEVVELLTPVAMMFHAHEQFVARAHCLQKLSIALLNIGDYLNAYQDARLAESIFCRDRHTAAEAADCRMHRASALCRLGRYPAAHQHYKNAEESFDKLGLEKELLTCQLNHAGTLLEIGLTQDAEQLYTHVEVRGALFQRAHAQLNRGNALQDLRRHVDAVRSYELAIASFGELGKHFDDIAAARMNRAGALRVLTRWDEALPELVDAEAYFSRRKYPGQLLVARLLLADVLTHLNRFPEALGILKKIDPTHLGMDSLWRYHSWYAATLVAAREVTDALEHLEQAIRCFRIARRAGVLNESNVEFVDARVRVVFDTIRVAVECGRYDVAWNAMQEYKGVLLLDSWNKRQSVAKAMAKSWDLLEPLRNQLCNWLRYERYELFERRCSEREKERNTASETDRDLIAEAVGQECHEETFLRATSYLRAVEGLARRESRRPNKSRGPDGDLLRDVQRKLPSDWAILDLWVRAGELLPFVITRDTIEMAPVSVPWLGEQFKQAVVDIDRWRWAGGGGRDEALDALYNLLVAPLIPCLRGLRGLYVVPNATLHAIPLHALPDSEGVMWGEEIKIAYLPTAGLLPRLAATDMTGTALSVVNPDRQSSATLPMAEWEANCLQQQYGAKHTIWSGNAATTSNLSAWSSASLVHLATHGCGYSPLAMLSHATLNDDLLLAHDVLFRMPPLRTGSFVVLNLCESGTLDSRSFDNGIGLVQAFLGRGASCVLSTQWQVHDVAAAEMVVTFVDEFERCGRHPCDALQAAVSRVRTLTAEEVIERCQRLKRERFPAAEFPDEWRKLSALETTLAEKRPTDCPYSHPRYWASFQLSGRVHQSVRPVG